eukprot:CAMPEP_0170731634 /NCGR_PEP_ID=MMETSP0437-20130122/1144_1 /TAXON_ID=0 /ORGANISM="Sexangularia sp." /LENGTH=132 /DNA_ID=CAMNT_0011069859 /DNA_START=68 /DNA_END=466 /DNA_ORIENTATION=+
MSPILVFLSLLALAISTGVHADPSTILFAFVRETGEVVPGATTAGITVHHPTNGTYCVEVDKHLGDLGTYLPIVATVQSLGSGSPAEDIASIVVNTGTGNDCNKYSGVQVQTFTPKGKLADYPFSLMIPPRM